MADDDDNDDDVDVEDGKLTFLAIIMTSVNEIFCELVFLSRIFFLFPFHFVFGPRSLSLSLRLAM